MRKQKLLSDEDISDILLLVTSGISMGTVAEYYSVSRQYIFNICRKNNLTKRRELLTHEQMSIHPKTNGIVTQAIAKGILIPEPCEVCGVYGKDEKGKRRVQAHHDDYNKPLQVRWLCLEHHKEWHTKNRAIPSREKNPKKVTFTKILQSDKRKRAGNTLIQFCVFLVVLMAFLWLCVYCWNYQQRLDHAEADRVAREVLASMPPLGKLTLTQRQAKAYRDVYGLTAEDAARPVDLWH